MRIGIVSDIHNNIRGLEWALDDMGEVDAIISAGDACLEYSFSNPVFDLIRERGMYAVRGNHEAVVLSHHGERLRRSGAISTDNLDFLQMLPLTMDVQLDGKRLHIVHATPWSPIGEYLYPTSPDIRRLADVDADIVVMGHTHFPMIMQVGTVLAVNPGSAGEGRDHRLGARVSYAYLDTEREEAVIRVVADPKLYRGREEYPAPWPR